MHGHATTELQCFPGGARFLSRRKKKIQNHKIPRPPKKKPHTTTKSISAGCILGSISKQRWSVTTSLLSGKHWRHHTRIMDLLCNLNAITESIKLFSPQNPHYFCSIWNYFFLVTHISHKYTLFFLNYHLQDE